MGKNRKFCGCTCAIDPYSLIFPGRRPTVALSYHDNGKPYESAGRKATGPNQRIRLVPETESSESFLTGFAESTGLLLNEI